MPARRRPSRGQTALPDLPRPAETYWEHVGPRTWQPVTVTTRYATGQPAPEQRLPLVRTRPVAPRNVTVVRADGSSDVVPVRTLRRERPPTAGGSS